MLSPTYGWIFTYFIAASSSSGGAAGGLFGIIFGLVGYVFSSYCFYNIFQKLGEPNPWLAWIPFANTWVIYKLGDQSPWWVIGLFIPLVNIAALVFLIIAFVNVVRKLGKNPWLLLLFIIPLVNFAVLYYFAFS